MAAARSYDDTSTSTTAIDITIKRNWAEKWVLGNLTSSSVDSVLLFLGRLC